MDNFGGIRLGMQVVGPHALLIGHKEVCEYCIPVPDAARQRAGMRLDLVRTLWAAIELRRPRPAEANAMEIESLTPGFLLEKANETAFARDCLPRWLEGTIAKMH